MNALALKLPELLGGSADLAPSNKTWLNGLPDFQKDRHEGRNFHFGVREHAMGAIVNGMAVNGGLIPYGGTFLVFADYMRGALRVSALSHYPSIWVFTHDSIGVGEDGPTHQPVEQVCSLRAIPNMVVLRPGDANEVREAWKVAITRRDGPTALALTRQALPTLDRKVFSPAVGLWKGAYLLAQLVGGGPKEVVLMASGSEVNLIVEAGKALMKEGFQRAPDLIPKLGAIQSAAAGISRYDPAAEAGQAVGSGSRDWDGLGALGGRPGGHPFDREIRRIGAIPNDLPGIWVDGAGDYRSSPGDGGLVLTKPSFD